MRANTEEILLIGDSITKNLQPSKLSRKKMRKKVYSGSQIQHIKSKEANLQSIGVKTAIIHAGTNNISNPGQSSATIARELEDLAASIQEQEKCNVIISGIMTRNDNDFDSKIESTNSELTKICEVRDWNANIDETCLNGSGLHLNGKGDSLLASNPTNALRGKGYNSPSGHSRGSRFTKLNYRGSNFQERDAKIVWNFLQLIGPQR